MSMDLGVYNQYNSVTNLIHYDWNFTDITPSLFPDTIIPRCRLQTIKFPCQPHVKPDLPLDTCGAHNPVVMQQIWAWCGRAEVYLFAT